MPVNWTNNFNDNQTTATVTCVIDGAGSEDDVTIHVDAFVLADSDGVGRDNWSVGDEIKIEDNTGLYTITSIGTVAGTDVDLGISPGLNDDVPDDKVVYKEGPLEVGYKGNQGSAENHLRLRNMGLI
jgi:hypothetical protein